MGTATSQRDLEEVKRKSISDYQSRRNYYSSTVQDIKNSIKNRKTSYWCNCNRREPYRSNK